MLGGGKKESDSLIILQNFLLLYTVIHDVKIELSKTISKTNTTIIKILLTLATDAPDLIRCF